jgi:hypothetical protein
MAKLSLRRRPRANNLRLQSSAVPSSIAAGCVSTPLTSVFIYLDADWMQRVGCAESSVATTPNSHCGCSFSKRRSLQQSSRPPKRQILRPQELWSGPGRGAQKVGIAK